MGLEWAHSTDRLSDPGRETKTGVEKAHKRVALLDLLMAILWVEVRGVCLDSKSV